MTSDVLLPHSIIMASNTPRVYTEQHPRDLDTSGTLSIILRCESKRRSEPISMLTCEHRRIKKPKSKKKKKMPLAKVNICVRIWILDNLPAINKLAIMLV